MPILMRHAFKTSLLIATLAATALTASLSHAQDRPAKEIFGHIQLPNSGAASSHGSYAKGCQSGAVALASDGETWQAMRLSRNRRWGQPQLVRLVERFSRDAQTIGWPGLLVGDISQSRGGPMLSGHASHQIGLDVDIWFQPMPAQRLSEQQRETFPFVSMLDKSKFLTVDNRKWSTTHANLVMMAASYPTVERIFVNPAIKKKLCQTWKGDRDILGKVRPVYGHDEHFHIRMECPKGSKSCKPQASVPAGDGCDKSLDWWFTKEPWAKPKPNPNAKPPKPPRPMALSDLPAACAVIARDGAGTISPQTPVYTATMSPTLNSADIMPLPEIGPMPYARPSAY
jgi:penicillin-insensitive murein endopeptidase